MIRKAKMHITIKHSPSAYLLGALEIAMDDLVRVEVLHSVGDLLRPRHQSVRRDDVPTVRQDLMQRSERAEFHDYAKHWRLGAYASACRECD